MEHIAEGSDRGSSTIPIEEPFTYLEVGNVGASFSNPPKSTHQYSWLSVIIWYMIYLSTVV
jgi:hypothetical protein